MIFRAVIAINKGIFINTYFLLERCCLPAILKACTALKKALRIDHLYIAKGSAPGKKIKSSLLKKSLKSITRGGGGGGGVRVSSRAVRLSPVRFQGLF